MKHNKNLVFAFLLLLVAQSPAVYAEDCTPWVAMAISVQGDVERRVIRNERQTWLPVKSGEKFCSKDVLRVRQNSRAALVLTNNTIVRLDENTTITFSNLSPDSASTLDIQEGIAHFISRVKQLFKVITPFVNASIEGTEFVVTVAPDQAEVTVFEGVVRAENDKGQVVLKKGQTAVALKDQAPVLKTLVKPRNAVQWALYYPTILQKDDINPKLPDDVRSILARSMIINARGNASAAATVADELPDDLQSANVYSYRAELRLTVGRIAKAKEDIERALAIDNNNSNALALKSIVAVVQNRAEDAQSLAERAINSNPQNSAPYLALSYAKQAQFDLDAAQQSLNDAPDTALINARRAELYLIQGNLDSALDYANRAVSKNVDYALSYTVLGYAYLILINTENAKKAFDRAIELDQTSPLAHMGMGLALIREGELGQGRREMEYAASLDPNNSLIRSYLGKAYYEEGRNKVAADQFGMAKDLDPKDPTPWFYDAIRKQTENDAVGALKNLEESISRNDNRIVYRSRLNLDQDNASKSVDVGKIYSELGFEQMAIQQAAKSLTVDPTNHSAHRFLADMYLSLPRHEIATTSEILQAQLLQPINTTPANQRLSYGNLGTISEGGSLNIGYNEYSSLFERNRNNFSLSTLFGGNNTDYYDMNYFGVYDNISLSASIFDYQSDGYRINNDQDDNLKNVLIQYALFPNLTFHYEFDERKSTNGDIIQRFGENNFDPNLREDFSVISERIGFRYKVNPKHNFLFSYLESDRDFLQTTNDGFFFDEFSTNNDGRSAEFLYTSNNISYDVLSGIGYSSQDLRSAFISDFGMGPTPLFDDKYKIRYKNAYIYSSIFLNDANTIIFGVSYDAIENLNNNIDSTNPKFGYIYNGKNNITFRLAAFRTLKRPILSDQTLEPVQIAGFNQFFDEGNGTEAKRYGIGIDKKFSNNIYSGIEFTKRELTVDLSTPQSNFNIYEKLHRAYFSWLANSSISLNAEIIYEDFESLYDPLFGNPNEPAFYTTKSLPVSFRYFNNNGFSTNLTATYVEQDITFENIATMQLEDFGDTFTIVDFTIGLRSVDTRSLSNLQVNLGIKNIFDEEFNYHNTNTYTALPRPLTYYPERYVYGKLQFNF